MKKALAGCLVVVLLAVVVGGIAGYWFVLRPAWNAGSAFFDQAQQWQQIAELDQQVRNTDAFDAPADAKLVAARVDIFLDAQGRIVSALGNDWSTLETRINKIEADSKANGSEPGLQDVLQTYSDIAGLVLTAKQAQVDALNRSGMSLAEYRWIREQAFTALPLLATDQIPEQFAGTAAAANAELLRPHRDELAKSLATSVLGF